MFKTLLSTLLLLTAVLSVQAADYQFIPKWTNFTEQDKKFLEETTLSKWDSFKAAFLIQEAAKSNPKIYTDVEEFEKAWEATAKTCKSAFKTAVVCNMNRLLSKSILLHVHRNYINDPNNYVRVYFPIIIPEITSEAFGGSYYKMFEKSINEIAFFDKNCGVLKALVGRISKYSTKLTPAEELSLLKRIKRNYYKNIQKSDEWKPLMVEVELGIKSLE